MGCLLGYLLTYRDIPVSKHGWEIPEQGMDKNPWSSTVALLRPSPLTGFPNNWNGILG